MRKILIIVLLMLVSTVAAEKGIVLDANNVVQYKFDLPQGNGSINAPRLDAGQYIVFMKTTEQVNVVLKGATYNPTTKTFTNPVPVTPAYEEIEIQAKPSAVDPNILILSGAGITSAYLIARRKKAA